MQRQRRLRARRLRDVVRHGRPVGHRGHVEPHAGVLEDADDAGRPLVRRLLELEPVDQLGLGGGAGDRDRPGVRGVGEQRAEGDHELAAELVAGGEQLGAELAPAHVGLDAAHQDHVAVEVRAERRSAIWVLGQVSRRWPCSSVPTTGRLTWKS